MSELDLYAKVEHLLGIEEATRELHKLFSEELEEFEIASLLDVGCGRGGFMELMRSKGVECQGIDKSSLMVEACRAKGLSVSSDEIYDVHGEFDAIVAIFDVLNFFTPVELERFLAGVEQKLKSGGVFVADINSRYGFSEVAEGCMSAQNESEFLVVDAVFDDDKLETQFTLFSKDGECYQKEQRSITQYFHTTRSFEKSKGLKVLQKLPFSLYDEKDKVLLVLQKI